MPLVRTSQKKPILVFLIHMREGHLSDEAATRSGVIRRPTAAFRDIALDQFDNLKKTPSLVAGIGLIPIYAKSAFGRNYANWQFFTEYQETAKTKVPADPANAFTFPCTAVEGRLHPDPKRFRWR